VARNADDRGVQAYAEDPYATGFRGRERGMRGQRPWVGGYRAGYQGGSEGIPVRSPAQGRQGPIWGGDERRREERAPGGYDTEWGAAGAEEAYRRFNRATRLRYSPVGGMHPAMGGEYKYRGVSHPGIGYDGWYNRRTRWF
jgi:hypothetical protein